MPVAGADLGINLYMAGGGRYRRRRFGVLYAAGDVVTRKAHQPHVQSRDYNQLMQAIGEGKEDDRLVLVTKSIRPGVNPETWGKVWRKDWILDFYEFLPEGGFRHERFAYPHARSAEQQEALRQAERDGGLPELNTRSWQFQMAHLLMPEGSSPRIIAGDSPLVAVGWVFPVGVFSVLAATVFLLLAFAPQRTASPAPAGD